MNRIQDIPLTEVFEKYAKSDIEPAGSNRYKLICPFHKDTNPSLLLYDKTEQGLGWDYHCFSCHAHGSAVNMLTSLKICTNESEATAKLMRDFGIVLPSRVSLDGLATYKGLDIKEMQRQGWEDTDDGVDIPYHYTNGKLAHTKVRVKFEGKGDKFFYRGESIDSLPYGLNWLDGYPTEILYITEGETDTMTMKQAGFPVLGLSGNNGFKPEYADYMRQFRAIVVVRDNDEAGWTIINAMSKYFTDNLYMTVLPHNCKDINNFHQHHCNSNTSLFQQGFSKLQVLPATPLTFIEAVIAGSVIPTDKDCWAMIMRCLPDKAELLYYKEKFAKAAKVPKTLINEAIKAATKPSSDIVKSDGEFIIQDGCYYKQVFRGEQLVHVRISNFVIAPQYDMYIDTEVTRVVDLVNCDGNTAKAISFDAETLASCTKFNQKCLGAGDFIFTGDQQDLFKMCYTIFNVPKDTVYSPRMIGRVTPQHWLFSNCGIDSTGAVVPIRDGIVKLDGVSYRPRGVCIADEDGDTGNSGDIPVMNYHKTASLVESDTYAKDLIHSFSNTFGTMGAWTSLGWVVAGFYSQDIFAKLGFYPYLFVTGKRASGKSVFCTMLQSAFGFNPNNAGMSIESPTNVGIMRYLAYRSSLPQWYDDYRNGVKRIQMKDNLLLDAYNRHGSIKGTKDGGVTREAVNGYLLLSGEDIPSNNALLSRCTIITLSAYERNADVFSDAKAYFEVLPSYCLKFASESVKGLPEALARSIAETRDYLMTVTGDIRESSNKSVFAGAFLYAFGQYITEQERADYLDYLATDSVETVTTTQDDHPLRVFFDDFCDLPLVHNLDYIIEDNLVYIRIASCHYAWTQKHDRVAPLSKTVLQNYIRKEPYFISDTRKYFDSMGRQRCICVDISEMNISSLSGFYEFIKEKAGQMQF